MRACVIGVGNAFRGDDAVGLEVARLVAAAVGEDVPVVECEGEPVALLEAWDGFERAIVVDAMQSGARPGTIRRVEAHEEPLPPDLRRPSTHLLGLADAVELARTLGRLPGTTVVYGIEGEHFEAGTELTPAVAAAAPVVARSIREELEES